MIQIPQAVLFDLDGTLLDTAPDLGAALNHVLKQHGFPEKTYEEFRVESSNGALGLLKMGMGSDLNNFDIELLRKQLLDFYELNICRFTDVFAGIPALIKQIQALNIPWGIITNKPGFLTTSLLANFPLFEGCRLCYSGDSFKNRKPHPEPLLRAADELGIQNQSIWYVGDAKRDMEAAEAAAMVPVLARYGYLTEQELEETWQVALAVDHADELSAKLKSLAGK